MVVRGGGDSYGLGTPVQPPCVTELHGECSVQTSMSLVLDRDLVGTTLLLSCPLFRPPGRLLQPRAKERVHQVPVGHERGEIMEGERPRRREREGGGGRFTLCAVFVFH